MSSYFLYQCLCCYYSYSISSLVYSISDLYLYIGTWIYGYGYMGVWYMIWVWIWSMIWGYYMGIIWVMIWIYDMGILKGAYRYEYRYECIMRICVLP